MDAGTIYGFTAGLNRIGWHAGGTAAWIHANSSRPHHGRTARNLKLNPARTPACIRQDMQVQTINSGRPDTLHERQVLLLYGHLDIRAYCRIHHTVFMTASSPPPRRTSGPWLQAPACIHAWLQLRAEHAGFADLPACRNGSPNPRRTAARSKIRHGVDSPDPVCDGGRTRRIHARRRLRACACLRPLPGTRRQGKTGSAPARKAHPAATGTARCIRFRG